MDPDLVYSRYRDEALAAQFEATEYSVFVAMPFRNRFSYHAKDIYDNVIKASATKANELLSKHPIDDITRRFGTPRRIDDQPQTARDIGGEIAKAILEAHVVIADLTFANDGVLLEVGASLALKSTKQIVLITQGDPKELHFDIKGNNVIQYSPDGTLDTIASALFAAATDFEQHRKKYLTHLSRELSHDAILLMNYYGRHRTGYKQEQPKITSQIPFCTGLGVQAFLNNSVFDATTEVRMAEATIRYQLAIRELISHRLMYTDYQPRTPKPGIDRHEHDATTLGWMFIEHMWDDLERSMDESTP
jgi:hypothetical protein